MRETQEGAVQSNAITLTQINHFLNSSFFFSLWNNMLSYNRIVSINYCSVFKLPLLEIKDVLLFWDKKLMSLSLCQWKCSILEFMQIRRSGPLIRRVPELTVNAKLSRKVAVCLPFPGDSPGSIPCDGKLSMQAD